jgi:hypothetical protein
VNHPAEPATRSERWLLWLFVACLIHAIWALSAGWNHSILGLHGFRQTQTAMAVEYMLSGSNWLRYETPFLGVPWSIPFELPLFQWIVAVGSKLLGTPVVQTARLVSVAFFLATIPPLISLQTSLGIRGNRRLILPSLFLMSPIYVFWSRAVMIESTALFFATAYLALLAVFLFGTKPGRARTLSLSTACGAIAAMVKITTFATFLLAALVLLMMAHRGQRPGRSLAVGLLAGLALPVVAGLAWTRFAEAQRELNPLAQSFLTGSTMSSWFLGTLRDRLSLQAWEATLTRTVRDAVGNWGVVLGAFLLSFAAGSRGSRRFLICLGLFISAPALILHLHRTHEYYPYANSIFLLGAVAWTIAGTMGSGTRARRLGLGLFALAVMSCLIGYRRFYHRVQVLDVRPDPGLLSATQRSVRPEGVLLIFGSYWSPELPYYLGRRAIMNRDDAELDSPVMRRAREDLARAGYRVEALLACNRTREDTGLIRQSLSALGLAPAPSYKGADCDLFGVSP